MAAFVDVTFTIERDEYIRAIRRHYRSHLKVNRDIIGGLLAISGGLYLLLATEQSAMSWLLIVPGAILLVMVAYALLILPSVLYRSQPKLRSEYRLHFDDNGIAFDTADIHAQLTWRTYHAWLCDEDFYILYHGTRDLSVVPKRSLTEEEFTQLEALLERNIGPGLAK